MQGNTDIEHLTNTMKNAGVYIVLLLFLISYGCKKSRWNPKCWKQKENATIVNLPTFGGPCPAHFTLESTGEVYSFLNEVPERFKPEVGETIEVKVVYHFVEGFALPHGCNPNGFVEIDCIQLR